LSIQIVQQSNSAKLLVAGNARIVTMPKTASEYCAFYGIPVKDGTAILHKAVQPDLRSYYDSAFQYTIGKEFKEKCDPSVNRDCSNGLHVSHKSWAIDFGRTHIGQFTILECAVPLDKIVVPVNGTGKIRTSELMVLREVPMEEWGIYGKILAKQMKQKEA